MNTFLKILRVFFVILGIIFFLIIVTSIYLYQTDFYNIKTMVTSSPEEQVDSTQTQDANPALNAEQEQQLQEAGIDPASVPSEITPEMEKCFLDKLGEERVKEIEGGAEPTSMELIKVSPCL